MKEITGTIVDVRFTSPTFSAGVLKSEQQGNIDFRGRFPASRGDEVTLVGSWSKYKGRPQFEAKNVLRNLNFSEEGLARYLANNSAFVGLGPVKARRIAEKFDKDFGTVIVENPEAVAKAGPISIEAARNIRAEWVRNQAINASATELSAFGLTHHQVQTLIDKYGDDAVSIIKSNPYKMDIAGYRFKGIDAIARKIGIAKDFPPRVRAGIIDCVDTALDKGHCWIEETNLIEQANKLLVMDALNSRDIIEHELDALIKEGKLACDSHDGRWLVARKSIHMMEREVEGWLRSGDQDNPHVFDLLGVWKKVRDGKLCPELNSKQRKAVVVALTHQISTISGGGGSGKTFTIGKLTKLYEDLGFRVQLCALAGKAARRLEEVVGVRASTIHRLLGFNGHEWAKGPDDLIDANVIIVDESSMVDIPLAWRLLRSIDHEHTAVVFVGDHNQLPPVGPGDLLRDLIHTEIVPGVVLTDIVRQAGELRQNSIDVLSGKVAKTSDTTLPSGRRPWYRIDNFTDAWDVRRLVCDLYESVLADKLGYDLIDDVQLLTPKRKDPLGVEELNLELQRLIQKKLHGIDVPVLKPRQRPHFLLHDKVIQRRNNYDLGIMNGSIGRVAQVLSNGDLHVRFENSEVTLKRSDGDLSDLQLAYCLTIHQTQGSEFPCAVVVIHKSHSFMHSQNLFYTGVSRAQETTIIVGDRWGIRNCAQKQANDNRNTFLGLWRKDGQAPELMEAIHG